MTNYTNDQKVAAVCSILDDCAELTNRSDAEREFVRHTVCVQFAGTEDEGTRVALDTVAAHLYGDVSRILNRAHTAARDVVRAERWASLKAEGKRPCSRCDATGTFINGGECYGCDGRGYRA
jgi:hypothetical protein